MQRNLPTMLQELGWAATQIDLIEDDLGTTAYVPESRQGFNRLLDRMRADVYGAVAVNEDSRLLRHIWDLARLATVAYDHDVLLIQPGRITNFRDPNDEFIGIVLGAIAARENRMRVKLARQARREKAKQGKAITRPPTGYVKAQAGIWDKDPNPRVREVIQLVFDKFVQLSTVGRVCRHLLENDIALPRRRSSGRLEWVQARKSGIRGILTNEAYAGVYIFGKTEVVRVFDPASGGRRERVVPAQADPPVRKPNQQPAYISPEVFAHIQTQLHNNQNTLIGPLGRGEALVQGFLHCTVHHRVLRTAYPGRGQGPNDEPIRLAQYRCLPKLDSIPATPCIQIHAKFIDPLIEAELFRTLVLPSQDFLNEAAREALREYEAMQHSREDELRRARATAAELERQSDQTDSRELPFVKRRLQVRYEEALREIDRIEASHRRNPLVPPLVLDEAKRARLRELASDLPRLWRDPNLTPEHRKAVVRIAIRRVLVTPGHEFLTLKILWDGSETTTLEVATPKRVGDEIEAAYRAGNDPSEIAEDLNRRGRFRRFGKRGGQPYDPDAVNRVLQGRRLRHRLNLEAYQYIRTRVLEHALSPAIAEELNAEGVRPRLGLWTPRLVQAATHRLRHKTIPGVDPLPRVQSIRPRIEELTKQGLLPREIVARLNAEGFRTRHRSPVTLTAVYQNLKLSKLPAATRTQAERVAEFLKTTPPTSDIKALTRRLNELGFRTRWGTPFTANTVYRITAKLDLRVPTPRHKRRVTQTKPAADKTTMRTANGEHKSPELPQTLPQKKG